MLGSLLPAAAAADGGANIFNGIDAADYTEIVSGSAIIEGDGSLFTTSANTVVRYGNVTLDRAATHMDITYSTGVFSQPRQLELRLDSAEGEAIASVSLRETTQYTYVVTDTIEINCNEIGTHDLYLTDVNGGAARIFSIKMYGSWTENDLTDKADTAYNNNQKLLKSLGIISSVKAEEESDYYITRAEYAEIICKTFSKRPIKGNPYGFVDEEGSFEYLNVLVQKNYLAGVGGYIRPNDKAALADVAEAYIRMSGYGIMFEDEKAEVSRDEVLDVAAAYGFTDGIKAVSNKYTTYRDIVNMTVNTLLMPAPRTTITGINREFGFDDEATVLEDLYNAKKAVGTVTANENTSLNTNLEYEADGFVKIDGVEYLSGDSGAENYLGYRVRYYYRVNDDDVNEVLFIYDTDKLNTILTIDSQDIETKGGNKLTYTSGERLKSITIPQTADFIYNEVCCTDYTDAELDINEGSITFIDNDKDGKYEVVKVKSAEVYVVDTVDVEGNIIYPKTGSEFTGTTLTKIDLNSKYAENTSIKIDGIRGDLQAVKAGYTVSVYDSKKSGGKVMRRNIEISSKIVSAKIISYNRYNECTTDSGIVYKKSVSSAQTPEIGARYELHISVYGTVAWFETTPNSRTYRYGFVTKTFFDEEEDNAVCLKLLDEDGAFLELQISEKATIDGYKADSHTRVLELLLNGDESFTPQLIRYKTNSEAKITMVDTAYVSPKEDKATSMVRNLTQNQAQYGNSTDYFWQVAPVSNETILFSMPFEYDQIARGIREYADSEYSVMKNARQFIGLNAATEGFDGSVVKPMNAVVKYKNSTTTAVESNPMIYITDVSEVLDANDEVVTQVEGIYNGKIVQLVLTSYAEKDYGPYLKEGDVWFYTKDAKGKVAVMIPLWTKDDLAGFTRSYNIKNAAANSGNLYVCYSDNIMDKYKNNISIDLYGTEAGFSLNNANIVLYDKKTGNLQTITPDQIAKNSQTDRKQYVFLYSYAKITKYLIIVNE